MEKRKTSVPGEAWNGEAELAPTPLLGEYEENGVMVKRYAPGWALGVKPDTVSAKPFQGRRR